mmetsp:Transcript_3092/g.4728  ORF Transcript_3092/g.4728 Transcript_3092/m.4728 type:complete len:311 (+) Transcript_3092:215-1147(+)
MLRLVVVYCILLFFLTTAAPPVLGSPERQLPLDSSLTRLVEIHKSRGIHGLFSADTETVSGPRQAHVLHGLLLWEGDHFLQEGSGHLRHFTHGAGIPSSGWYISVDIYVKESGNATLVQQVIESFGTLDARFDRFVGGSFGARLTVDGIEAVASLPDVLLVRASERPRVNTDLASRLGDAAWEEYLGRLHRRHLNAAAPNPIRTPNPNNPTGTNLSPVALEAMEADVVRQCCPNLTKAGEGITIAIISDSFDMRGGYANDVTNGKRITPTQSSFNLQSQAQAHPSNRHTKFEMDDRLSYLRQAFLITQVT